MHNISKPFRITIEHYDEKISIERNASDITFEVYMKMLRSMTAVVFSEVLWNNYFEEQ